MNLIERLETLERIHELVLRKRTGTPVHLARKLGMSKRSLFLYIDLMRKMGAPIEYCKSTERYFYKHEVDFRIGFVQSDRLKRVIGGKAIDLSLIPNIYTDVRYISPIVST